MQPPVGSSPLFASAHPMGKQTSNENRRYQPEGQVHPHSNGHNVHTKGGFLALQDLVEHEDHTPDSHTNTNHVPGQIALTEKTFDEALE